MPEKLDNDEFYAKLVRAKSSHARAFERALSRNGIEIPTLTEKVTVPANELDALKAAVKYEEEDIAGLKAALEKTVDPLIIRILERQIAVSGRHAATLSSAVAQPEGGASKIVCNLN